MQSTQRCPKCSGRKFAVSAEFRQPLNGTSNLSYPSTAVTIEIKGHGMRVPDRRITTGRFESWICLGCGYTEFYAHGLENLEALAKQHPDQLRIVDAGPPEKTPYR